MNRLRGLLARHRTYPYTNARVRAMRGGLITDDEYRKLTKMSLAEITEFLNKRGYSESIDVFSGDYRGADLIVRALNRNLSQTYQKIIRISPDHVSELLWIYYRKFDIMNLKLILRKIARGAKDDVTPLLFSTPHANREELRALLEYESVEDVLGSFSIPGFDGSLLKMVEDPTNLPAVEDTLDRYYTMNLLERSRGLAQESSLFRRFLEVDASIKNVTLILRMQRRGYESTDILERLIDLPNTGISLPFEEMALADDYEAALAILKETKVGTYIKADSPAEVSRALERYKLERGIHMLHRDQLSINPILGFMICKEIEIANVRMIVRAKEEDLGEDFIERNLIKGVAK